jgi:hypothetical protein
MTNSAEPQAPVRRDLDELLSRGSGADVLGGRKGISSLALLEAVNNVVDVPAAVRALLEAVLSEPDANQIEIQCAAALTGIRPKHTGKGLRGNPGAKERRKIAEKIREGVSQEEALARVHEEEFHRGGAPELSDSRVKNYLDEYASAILAFARFGAASKDVAERYFDRLNLSMEERQAAIDALFSSAGSYDSASRYVTSRTGPTIALSAALAATRTACQAARRPIYTSDVLLALLTMPESRVGRCFDQVQDGLGEEIRASLASALLAAPAGTEYEEDWLEGDEVQAARRFALEDRKDHFDEIHLLLAILWGESKSVEWLARRLNTNMERLREVANEARHRKRKKTPSGFLPEA